MIALESHGHKYVYIYFLIPPGKAKNIATVFESIKRASSYSSLNEGECDKEENQHIKSLIIFNIDL